MKVSSFLMAANLVAAIVACLSLGANGDKQAAKDQDLKSNKTTESATNATEGRSFEMSPGTQPERSRARAGRMLDLDHLAGEIGKDEKVAKERALSGQRQSRNLALEGGQFSQVAPKSAKLNLDARSRKSATTKTKKTKRMEIKGFIPIVSLEKAGKGSKQLADHFGANEDDDESPESDENENENDGQEENQQAANNLIKSNYGTQTSIGHASYGLQPGEQASQQQSAESGSMWHQVAPQYDQQEAGGRANRKLTLGAGSSLLGNLAAPSRRFVSSLVPTAGAYQLGSSASPWPIQAPMNSPSPVEQPQQECVCVPFYQCKGGYLSDTQLSRSQLIQILSSSPSSYSSQLEQTPRALDAGQPTQGGQQSSDLYYANQSPISSLMSQLNGAQRLQQVAANSGSTKSASEQQQFVNDIYEQLKKNIESENLEQQLQQQQQQQQQAQQQPNDQQQPAYLTLDDRSNGQKMADNSSADLLGRSILAPLVGRRSSSLGAASTRCGIMRTCCKIPPHLLNQQLAPPFRGVRSQPMMRPLQVPFQVAHHQQQQAPMLGAPHAHHQYLHPSTLAPSNQLLAASGSNQRQLYGNHQVASQALVDYQPLPSTANNIGLLPSLGLLSQNNHLQASSLSSQPDQIVTGHQQLMQLNSQRPAGSFMAGRCGSRQALGVSGRVQNVQPAPGSESVAEFGEFPAHAAILKRLSPGDSLFVCSAVLISNQWLATAAHCVRKLKPEELKVRLGEWDVSRDDEFYPHLESNIRQLIIHPDFQPGSLANDLALLRMDSTALTGEAQSMAHIAPACLPTMEEQQNLLGQRHQQARGWIAGWGKDAFGQVGAFQSTLKKVDLPVVGRQECELALRSHTRLGKHFRLHPSAICAGGEQGKDACEGDGGSGLYWTDPESGLTKALGLVSWGVGCGQQGVPGVYTNLAHFYHWIESVVSNSGEPLDNGVYGNSLMEQRGQVASVVPDNFRAVISERSNQANSNSTTIVPELVEARAANNGTEQAQAQQPQQEQPSASTNKTTTSDLEQELESRAAH